MWNSFEKIFCDTVTEVVKAQCADFIHGVRTGYKQLDRGINGLQPCNLITIGGASRMGKSAFMLNILRHLAVDNNIPVLLFSSEMNDLGIGLRLASQESGIEIEKLSRGMLAPYEWGQLDKRTRKLSECPLYIESSHQLYIEDVINVARKAVKELGVKLIAVDYLQLMYYKARMSESRYVEVNAIISQLKSLSMELNIPVIVLSQLNNKIEQRDSAWRRPMPSDLRDSGTIYSDSDVVIFLDRPELYHIYQDENGHDLRGMMRVEVSKNRNGYPFVFDLKFIADTMLICEPDEKKKEEEEMTLFVSPVSQ